MRTCLQARHGGQRPDWWIWTAVTRETDDRRQVVFAASNCLPEAELYRNNADTPALLPTDWPSKNSYQFMS